VSADRIMLLVAHTGRPAAARTARAVVRRLTAAGITVRVLASEATDLDCAAAAVVPAGEDAAEGAEMVVVIGGDGTLLRAAELARPAGVPLLGVNLGHVGFLAEAEPDKLSEVIDRLVSRRYAVEQRMSIDVSVRADSRLLVTTWALNEATVEKSARERVINLVTEVDGRPLSRWGCDGIVFATPTGSTAYAFSAGGPIVWPEVEALLLVPISAHALFARPMVISPRSVLAAELTRGGADGHHHETSGAVLWCDGRRRFDLPPGARVEIRRGTQPVLLARLRDPGDRADGTDTGASFTDRLVTKFELPVAGWRGKGPAGLRVLALTQDEEPGGHA